MTEHLERARRYGEHHATDDLAKLTSRQWVKQHGPRSVLP